MHGVLGLRSSSFIPLHFSLQFRLFLFLIFLSAGSLTEGKTAYNRLRPLA
uniref:Uncharacterized protein n=1 Tax=Anguilla anguilla TaxID=7936 RepID=A0A0E9PJF6_ANGAN